jgi:Cytotoxic
MKKARGRFVDTLTPARSKGGRRRWLGSKGQIFEEDTQHGELEKYNDRGKHEAAVDPDSGEVLKGPVKGRSIEV